MEKVRTSSNRKKRFEQKITESLPKEYVSIACSVEREMARWIELESMELEAGDEGKLQRRWTNRMEECTEYGVLMKNNRKIARWTPSRLVLCHANLVIGGHATCKHTSGRECSTGVFTRLRLGYAKLFPTRIHGRLMKREASLRCNCSAVFDSIRPEVELALLFARLVERWSRSLLDSWRARSRRSELDPGSFSMLGITMCYNNHWSF